MKIIIVFSSNIVTFFIEWTKGRLYFSIWHEQVRLIIFPLQVCSHYSSDRKWASLNTVPSDLNTQPHAKINKYTVHYLTGENANTTFQLKGIWEYFSSEQIKQILMHAHIVYTGTLMQKIYKSKKLHFPYHAVSMFPHLTTLTR